MRSKPTLSPVHAGTRRRWRKAASGCPWTQFLGAADPELEAAFFPGAIKQFRHGALYALPVDARPLMLYYDADYFAREQVPPPTDGSWNWDDLVENAVKLTRRREDGTPARWGLGAHSNQVWWALWQNLAEAVDPDTLQCRLQEPEAIEALQFIHGLIHSHASRRQGELGVAAGNGLWGTPGAPKLRRLSVGGAASWQGAGCARVRRHGNCDCRPDGECGSGVYGAKRTGARPATPRGRASREGGSGAAWEYRTDLRPEEMRRSSVQWNMGAACRRMCRRCSPCKVSSRVSCAVTTWQPWSTRPVPLFVSTSKPEDRRATKRCISPCNSSSSNPPSPRVCNAGQVPRDLSRANVPFSRLHSGTARDSLTNIDTASRFLMLFSSLTRSACVPFQASTLRMRLVPGAQACRMIETPALRKGDSTMLTRRTLIASTAVLAAGCGGLDIPFQS